VVDILEALKKSLEMARKPASKETESTHPQQPLERTGTDPVSISSKPRKRVAKPVNA
jgi:hypothetical protein